VRSCHALVCGGARALWRWWWEGLVPTICAHGAVVGARAPPVLAPGRRGWAWAFASPYELWRLTGFFDSAVPAGVAAWVVRMAGNAVPVPVARVMGAALGRAGW